MEPDPEPELTFLAFAGTARRLDGRPAVNPIQPVAVPLPKPTGLAATLGASAGAGPSSASSSKPADSTASGKAGTFVSTGNRLLDKLMKEKVCVLDKGGTGGGKVVHALEG